VEMLTGPWAQLGAVGLLAVGMVLLAVGRIVPRRAVRDLVERADRNAAQWQAAALAATARADEQAHQLGEVLAALRTVEMLVNHRERV
jgi:hypothetical protein